MWTCPRCRTENKDSTTFCKRCGEYVAPASKQQENSSEQAPRSQTPPAPVAPQQRARQPVIQPQSRPQPPPKAAPLPAQSPFPPTQVQPQNKKQQIPPTPLAQNQAASPNAKPAAPKRPLINNSLLKAARDQAVLQGETDQSEEHIDWSSASSVAGAMRTQVAQRRKGGAALPSDMQSELFGGDDSGDLRQAEPPHAAAALTLFERVEASISKRTLMLILAISLVALIAAIVGSNSVINSFDQGETPTLPVASLRVASLAGVWLGVDRSANPAGIPVTYLFTRPNWLIVTEPTAGGNAAGVGGPPSVVAQASYSLTRGALSMQPIGAANPSLIPSAAAVSLKGNFVKISQSAGGGVAPIQLARPAAIEGQWQVSGGGGRYQFSNGMLSISGGGAKPQTIGYSIAGGVIQVAQSPTLAAQVWQFTFDGNALLLYVPDAASPSAPPNFSAPLRLTRVR